MINDKILPAREEKQSRFSYGYIIVLASLLILLISWGAQYSFGVFLKPMLNEFGWSRAATSGAYSLNMILTGVFGIFAGRLSDRFGPRMVLTVCGILIGLGYLLMSQVTAIWQIYLFYGVLLSMGLGGIFVPLLSTIARWFVKRRGLATGVAVSGIGVGVIIIPPLANLLISTYSWQTSYVVLGIASIALIVILAQFMRRPSSQKTQGTNAVKTDSSNVQVQGISLRGALFTWRFWVLCVMYIFFAFGQYTIMVHIVAHATDIGISTAAAAMILSFIGVTSIISKVGMGSLGDKIGNIYIMIIVFTVTALSFLWALLAGELWMLYFFGVIFGLGYGGFVTMQSPLVADYFGLKAHGAIYGVVMFAVSIGGALGPLTAGSIYDTTGSYNWAFITCAILGVGGLILAIILKVARR